MPRISHSSSVILLNISWTRSAVRGIFFSCESSFTSFHSAVRSRPLRLIWGWCLPQPPWFCFKETVPLLFKTTKRVVTWLRRAVCLGEQPTFHDATNCFPTKWHSRNDQRNSILLTCHYPDLGSDTTHHQYGITAVIPQTFFRMETRGGHRMLAVYSSYVALISTC